VEKLIWPAINLFGLLGFILYKAKGPFFEFVNLRRSEIFEGLNRSRIQAEEAARRRKEVETRLASLETEKAAILSEWKERGVARAEALRERSRTLMVQMRAEAEQNKKALIESTRVLIAASYRRSVLQQVEQKLQQALTPDAHQKFNTRVIDQIGKGAGTA
jgi:F0F1-type ATP synthase membrane subunit b/b'